MTQIWIVRAGRDAQLLDTFLERGVVAIGLSAHLGAEVLGDDRKALVERCAQAHPEWTRQQAANHAGHLLRFKAGLKVGDEVATYDPNQRRYLLGQVMGEASHQPELCPDHPYIRPVQWSQQVARDGLSLETRNSLGAIQTLFLLTAKGSAELRENAIPLGPAPQTPPPVPPEERGLDELRREQVEKASDFIEDLIARLDPFDLQDLVAGILRAMGYKTRVSSPGSDRGIDIFASPDGLGLQEPRIFVEVKHRLRTAMGAPEIRSFLGGRKPSDRCLYVSTGGFTREARYEAERSPIPLTLLSLSDLRELLVEHYEAADAETRRLVPLVRLYWPVSA